MKRIVRLTESDLVKLVKKVLKEQSNPLEGWDKLKEGQKIVLKNDIDGSITFWIVDATSPNPGQGGSGTKLFLYPEGEESRKLTPGVIEVSFFPKEMKVEMMNGMNSIVKDFINPSKKPIVKPQPIKPGGKGPQPIKPGGKGSSQLIHIVNLSDPNKVIMKLRPDYDLIWAEGGVGGKRQLVGKTDKGETVVMDYECGIGEENIIFDFIRIGYTKFMPIGKYKSVNRDIIGDCPVG